MADGAVTAAIVTDRRPRVAMAAGRGGRLRNSGREEHGGARAC